jgi:hypothetical protein
MPSCFGYNKKKRLDGSTTGHYAWRLADSCGFEPGGDQRMKAAGLLMLLAGWFIVLTAVVLLKAGVIQNLFIAAGMGVELLGVILFARSHLPSKGGIG